MGWFTRSPSPITGTTKIKYPKGTKFYRFNPSIDISLQELSVLVGLVLSNQLGQRIWALRDTPEDKGVIEALKNQMSLVATPEWVELID